MVKNNDGLMHTEGRSQQKANDLINDQNQRRPSAQRDKKEMPERRVDQLNQVVKFCPLCLCVHAAVVGFGGMKSRY